MIASCADDVRIWSLNDEARSGTVQSKPVKHFSPHQAARVSCICWNHNSDSIPPEPWHAVNALHRSTARVPTQPSHRPILSTQPCHPHHSRFAPCSNPIPHENMAAWQTKCSSPVQMMATSHSAMSRDQCWVRSLPHAAIFRCQTHSICTTIS